MSRQANQIKASYFLRQYVECCCFLNQSHENQNQVPAVCNSPGSSIIHFPLLVLLTRDATIGPFTQAIFVAQLNAIFVALKLQLQNRACKPAAISSQFEYSLSVQNVSARIFRKQKLCACSKMRPLLKVTVFRDLHLKLQR